MPHITDKFVRGVKPPVGKSQVRIVDDTIVGFGIRVTANGARSFFLNYVFKGRERRATIGKYPDWSVAAARERAKHLRREIDMGTDPLEQKDCERTTPTLVQLWDRYSSDVLPTKAESTAKDQRSIFSRLIEPQLGARKITDISYSDVERLHAKVSLSTPVQANRLLALLRHMMAKAQRWGLISDNPVAGVTLNRESPRERALTDSENKRLTFAFTETADTPAKLAIEMLFFTGARKSEVLNATWDQIDLETGIWTKPSSHTKQRKLHRVPLNSAAIDVLRRAEMFRDGNVIFPGRNGKPLGDVRGAFKKICASANIVGLRIHDLRHNFASILAEKGTDLFIIGKLLGHTQTASTARYAHHQQDVLRRATELAARTDCSAAS